jgi:hypothetical protein
MLPQNLVSRKPYRGVNVFMLHAMAYESPFWLTFKQAKEMGGNVRKGEHDCPVVFWKWLDADETDKATGKRPVPMLRYYSVFNVAQCDGVTAPAMRGQLRHKLGQVGQAAAKPVELEADNHVQATAPTPVMAFNSYGRMSVAYAAYQNLTPQVRDKANALLAKNPDYTNWVALLPPNTPAADTNLMLFMIAATWADRIKSEAGYAEDNPADRNKCGAMSAQNVGFTDHFRHRCWHFIDVAFAQDGTTNLPATPVPNAQERVYLFGEVLWGKDEDRKPTLCRGCCTLSGISTNRFIARQG